jgi:microcystin-dependent protein
MSTEPFIGEIKIFGFNFSPVSYDYCNGQTYSISEYSALFALIGTTYGGDGQSTFNLPDLRGRLIVGQGQGAGLPPYTIGQKAGTPSVTILTENLPPHLHTLNSVSIKQKASSDNADESSAAGNYPATTSNAIYSGSGATPNVFTGGIEVTGTTDPTGSGVAISSMNPYLVLNYCIAIEGIFPSRN